MNGRTVLFLHIPKTAGTTLNGVLDSFYGPRQTCDIYHPDNAWHSYGKYREVFAKRSPVLVRGHFYFGMHEQLSGPFTYITVLREPVDRVISSYYHIMNDAAHPFHRRLIAEGLDLRGFVESGVEFGNLQTRLIAGLLPPWSPCEREHLLLAKDNIRRHFSWVGITERFDESVLMLKYIMEWRHEPFYCVKNRAKKRAALGEISDADLEAVRKANSLDVELYEFALGELDAALTRMGAGFSEEVRAFRAANQKEAAIKYIRHGIKRKVKGLLKGVFAG